MIHLVTSLLKFRYVVESLLARTMGYNFEVLKWEL